MSKRYCIMRGDLPHVNYISHTLRTWFDSTMRAFLINLRATYLHIVEEQVDRVVPAVRWSEQLFNLCHDYRTPI